MDVGDKEKLEGEKKNEDSVKYHTHQLPSVAMANSYGAVVWDHHGNLQPCSSWEEPNSVTKDGFFVSPNIPNISQAPADSAFIERAARFSCFNSGNVTELIHSFPMNQPQPDSSYHQLISIPHGLQKIETNPPSTSKDEAKQIESDEADSDGARGKDKNSLLDNTNMFSLPKDVGHKKRRRRAGGQDTEPELSKQLSGEYANGNHIQSSPTTKINGKNSSDPQKEEYIHVRARRGQATNSHSLAERIRREKISERMKYLQDLVPGCSKVTGKAVMLDEIINYVQSLQRQVEFLSMKLATVDHKVDFNIDSLLAKEQLFPTLAGPSSSMGLSQDLPMAYPSMHPCQTPQLTSMMNQGYNESTQQIPNVWDYDLQFQNVVQMGFDHSNPVQNQGPKSPFPLSPTQTKPEP